MFVGDPFAEYWCIDFGLLSHQPHSWNDHMQTYLQWVGWQHQSHQTDFAHLRAPHHTRRIAASITDNMHAMGWLATPEIVHIQGALACANRFLGIHYRAEHRVFRHVAVFFILGGGQQLPG